MKDFHCINLWASAYQMIMMCLVTLSSFAVSYPTGHRRHAKVHERTPFLQWTVSGWAVVEYRGQLYKVSTAQMLVLMQFNDVDVSVWLVSAKGFFYTSYKWAGNLANVPTRMI